MHWNQIVCSLNPFWDCCIKNFSKILKALTYFANWQRSYIKIDVHVFGNTVLVLCFNKAKLNVIICLVLKRMIPSLSSFVQHITNLFVPNPKEDGSDVKQDCEPRTGSAATASSVGTRGVAAAETMSRKTPNFSLSSHAHHPKSSRQVFRAWHIFITTKTLG